jgi:hypothetical protein
MCSQSWNQLGYITDDGTGSGDVILCLLCPSSAGERDLDLTILCCLCGKLCDSIHRAGLVHLQAWILVSHWPLNHSVTLGVLDREDSISPIHCVLGWSLLSNFNSLMKTTGVNLQLTPSKTFRISTFVKIAQSIFFMNYSNLGVKCWE